MMKIIQQMRMVVVVWINVMLFKQICLRSVIARNEATSAYASQRTIMHVGTCQPANRSPQSLSSVNVLCRGCFVPRNDALINYKYTWLCLHSHFAVCLNKTSELYQRFLPIFFTNIYPQPLHRPKFRFINLFNAIAGGRFHIADIPHQALEALRLNRGCMV